MDGLPNKTKIVFLTDCLADLEGGAERQIFELAKRLDKSKYKIFIASLESEGKAPQEAIRTMGCQINTFPIKRIYGISGIREGFRFFCFLQREKIDILQTYHFSSDMWGTFVAHLAKVKILISNRRDIGFWRNRWHVFAYRRINQWVDKIVVNSLAGKRMVTQTERLAEEKIEVIYNGVDLTDVSSQLSSPLAKAVNWKKELGINNDELVIVHLANLKPIKGHQYLLKSFSEILPAYSRTKLLLIGEDELSGEMQRLSRELAIDKNVLFLGKRKDARQLLSVADICVLPSLSEGMSNAILEYMAAGKPVIATRVGGNPELIEQGVNGLLVEKEDVSGLKQALLSLIKDQRRRREMGENGLKRAKDQFAVERMVETYEDFFASFFNHPRRILHLISSAGLFGAENIVLSLSRQLNRHGIISIVAAFDDKRQSHVEILNRAQHEGIPYLAIKSQGRFDLTSVFRLKDYLKKSQIDLVHTHNYKSNLLGLVAARMTGIPIVATAHGYTEMTRAVSLYEKIDRFILRFFNRVIVVANSVLPRFPLSKKRIISNGLDIARFSENGKQRSEVRKKFAINENDLVIGTVGRLSKEKNQGLLLNAAAELIKKQSNLKFLIVGSGPEEKDLKLKTDNLKLTTHVIFTGLLTNMPEIYQAMDVFCLPSLTEGVPLTILEAMASKVPVVATRVGGVPGLIFDGKTGLLAESENVENLVVKLSDLIANAQKRGELSENAFRFVSENFSQDKMVENYRKVYEEILGC